MIDALREMDQKAAAGILTRAAFALENSGNPAADPTVPNEASLRAEVIREARSRVGVAQTDDGPDAIAKVCDYLDSQSDQLLGPADTDAALRRLAERGDLPSDLYEIIIGDNIAKDLGRRFTLEQRLIIATIRFPHHEQHYGRSKSSREPSLISLFARRFKTRWPFKDFTMLVGASRAGLILKVEQAWRLYDSQIDMKNNKDLVELLRRFATKYGAEIEIDGQKGAFFLYSDKPAPNPIKFQFAHGGERKFNVCQFSQRDEITGQMRAALIVSVDLKLYLSVLDSLNVKPEDMLDEALHRPPLRSAVD
jgi:hypothetical protein